MVRIGLCLVFCQIAVSQTFHEVSKVDLVLPSDSITSVARSETGDIYIYAASSKSIYHYSPQGALLNQFSVMAVPEASSAQQISFMPDVAADSRNVYISAVWRNHPRETTAGVFVFDINRGYVRTIVTNPLVEVRHLAVDGNGSLFLLGIDPAYFHKDTNLCLLIHKFSPDGARLTAFSACPAGNLRLPAGAAPGPDYAKLRQDVDLGSVWIQNGLVCHLLAGSHLLRVFDANGQQRQEVRLQMPAVPAIVQPPDPTTAQRNLVSRVMPIRGGRYLVEWRHGETTGGSQHNIRVHSVHDAAGGLASGPLQPTAHTVFLFSDDEGYAYMLRRTGQVAELVRVDVR